MRLRNLSYAIIGVLALGLSRSGLAQTVSEPLATPDQTPAAVATPRATVKPKSTLAKSALAKSKSAAKTKAASEKPAAPEPWAAVDPGRVAPRPANRPAPTDAESVAVRTKQADDAVSLGMKWNGSNTPNYGAATTSGLINEYNHDLGGASAGSGAEVGMKFKF